MNEGNVKILTCLISGPVPLGPAILNVLAAAEGRLKVHELRSTLVENNHDLATFDDDLAMLKLLKVVSGTKTLAATPVGTQVGARLARPVEVASVTDPRAAQAQDSLDFVLRYRPLGPDIVKALGPGPMTRSALAAAVGSDPADFLFGKVLGLLNMETQPAYSDPVLVAPEDSDERSLGDLGKAVLAILPADA